MWPHLFGIPARPLFIVLGTALAVVVCARRAARWRVQYRVATLALVLPAGAIVGLTGAKINSILERVAGDQPLSSMVHPLLWELQQGYRYPGGMIAVLGAFAVWACASRDREGVLSLGDLVAPAASLAMAVVRVGCFFAGCCHGGVSEAPWAVSFPEHSVAWAWQVGGRMIRADAPTSMPVHPLQLYFALWYAGLAAVLLSIGARRVYAGQVLLAFVALDNLIKFALEPLRDPPVPHLASLSLLLGLTAAAVLLLGWWRGWATPVPDAGASPPPARALVSAGALSPHRPA